MSRIILLVEGETEVALRDALKTFLDEACTKAGKPKVRLVPRPEGSDLFHAAKGRRIVDSALSEHDVTGVVALIDVKAPPTKNRRSFQTADDALDWLRALSSDSRYRGHVALHDFEAWLLPYWDDICKRLKRHQAAPGPNPERVNLDSPPSQRLAELYRLAGRGKYNKPRDGAAILKGKDLTIAAGQCLQLKAFLNSLLRLAECPVLK